jgi:myosin-crossreactive antigen
MVSNTTLGSMTEVPVQNLEKKSVAWTLWENIAEKNPEF